MDLQKSHMRAELDTQVGRRVRVLVESSKNALSTGRVWSQAPEVDGMVLLKGTARVGEMVNARLTAVRAPDLEGEILSPELARAQR